MPRATDLAPVEHSSGFRTVFPIKLNLGLVRHKRCADKNPEMVLETLERIFTLLLTLWPKASDLNNLGVFFLISEVRGIWASLVAQWLRIRLPMQGTWVRALVQEDPTCCRATKPMRHNYWTCALEAASHNYWSHVPQLLKPVGLEPMLCNKRRHCSEKHTRCNEE